MGRPPLRLKDPTVKTTIRLPKSLLDRVDQASDERRSAAFIREAIEEKLAREEGISRKPSPPSSDR